MKSHRVIWPRPNQVEIQSFDVADPGDGELLLEAECSLISPGTERGWLTGEYGFPLPDMGFPFNPGYAFAGRVLKAGKGATLRPGQRVITGGYGFGCHAAHVTFPEFLVDPIPDDVDSQSAIFWRLVSTALVGVRRAHIELGQAVAILGQGPIGLIATKLAGLCGAMPVIAIELDPGRLERSKEFGADLALNPKDNDALQSVLKGLPGGGFAAVIDLSSAPEGVNLGIHIARPSGRVVLVSPPKGEIAIDAPVQFGKGVETIGAFVAAGRPAHDSRPGMWTIQDDLDVFWRLIQSGRLDVKRLKTHQFKGEDAPQAYDLLMNRDPGLLGAVLQWS